ncbi:MAG: hypothetical protein JOZ73_14260 [Solirubrobacterales bacterium]|nr:hypothetical protein [Solirubrobacterales bacterium]
MHLKNRRPSPALIISLIALLVALGGTSYAAFKLPKNSVGTKQLKKNAVTTAKIKNKAVTGGKIKLSTLGTVPSANRANTATTAGSASPAAFAHVSHNGTLDAANSKNVGSVSLVSTSLYCIKGIPFTPRGGQATVDGNDSNFQSAQVAIGQDSSCPAGTQATVQTVTPSVGASPAGFYVAFYS